MKGSSQVIMGTTLILAATIAIVLGLVLFLLAELYCSLLLLRCRRHSQQQKQLSEPAALATALSATSATIRSHSSVNPPTPSTLSSFYAHGVLHAPRSLLFPALPSPEVAAKQYNLSEDSVGDTASAPPSFISGSLHGGISQEDCVTVSAASRFTTNRPFRFGPSTSNNPVYISNPIYDSDATDGPENRLPNTPFETPDSSPSSPEPGSSSIADDECDDEIRAWTGQEATNTPPLTPMKDLPACSIPLRDAGSHCTGSGTDSNAYHGLLSSSSSGTPCASPSW